MVFALLRKHGQAVLTLRLRVITMIRWVRRNVRLIVLTLAKGLRGRLLGRNGVTAFALIMTLLIGRIIVPTRNGCLTSLPRTTRVGGTIVLLRIDARQIRHIRRVLLRSLLAIAFCVLAA